MARAKEFDQQAALQAAIVTFAEHGFEGTSTDQLLHAMNIGRQSMYDTFGDKRQLYLTALRRYGADSLQAMLALLEAASTPLAGIEAVLLDFARNSRRLGSASCLGVSSVCEFGSADPEVAAINGDAAKLLERAFERQVAAAIAAKEIAPELTPREVARYLSSTLCGLKVAAQGGMSPAQLTSVARLALRALAA